MPTEEPEIQDSNAASAKAFQFLRKRKSVFNARDSTREVGERTSSVDGTSPTHNKYPDSHIFQSMDSIFSPNRPFHIELPEYTEKLNLAIVAEYFEKCRQISKSGFIPRFMFYSEKTGAVRAAQFNEIDINDFGYTIAEILEETFWIDICAPTTSEMAEISRIFGLHPLTAEDILTSDTREKCEIFNKYVFVAIKSFEKNQYKSNFLEPIPVYIIVFEECVLTFSHSMNSHSRHVRSRIDQLSEFGVQISPEWVNYSLIDDITDQFEPIIRVFETEVDSIEEQILILQEEEDHTNMLRKIGMVRKRVMQIQRLMASKPDVIKTLVTRFVNNEATETKFYLQDVQDHIITMLQNLNNYETSLARSHSNYLALISINITKAQSHSNDIVMRMTLLASILVPLNIITGLWGMNVRVPGEEGTTLAWFFSIVALMVMLAMFTYWFVVKFTN